MFVIKATLKDETRRLVFDGSKFPRYGEVQQKLRTLFNLPSSTHTFWVNVLVFPDDAQDARIMFKQHVCDASEFEEAQVPFMHTFLPAPALKLTVLLTSDPRLHSIHSYHRAHTLAGSIDGLRAQMSSGADDLDKRLSLVKALEDKLASCTREQDALGVAFWSDRAKEKRKAYNELANQLLAWQTELNDMNDELNTSMLGTTLRHYAEMEEREEVGRIQQTHDEIAAWRAVHDGVHPPGHFPPLEDVLRPHPPFGGWGHHHRGHRHHHARFGPPSGQFPPHGPHTFRDLFDRVTETVNNPASPNSLVPTLEIKSMLDTFLVDLSNQLAGTFDASSTVAANAQQQRTEQPIPGAFVNAEAQTQAEAKPCSKFGKGGFRHRHISCDGCLDDIRGMRYKCEQCPDYDLCGSCLPLLHSGELHPSTHTFKVMLHRGLEDRIKLPTNETEDRVRHPATCDLCSQNIIGVRWKCLNCPDWDCCSSCSATIQDTHPGHSFARLYKATDHVFNAESEAKAHTRHPHVVCDGCDESIRGPRYKCMHPDCPDYDLCEKCESSPFAVHPATHPMLKIKVPLRVNATSFIEHAQVISPRTKVCQQARESSARNMRQRIEHRMTQRREHVKLASAQSVVDDEFAVEPKIPGGYVEKSFDDNDDSHANLVTQMVPDTKIKSSEPETNEQTRVAEEDVKREEEVVETQPLQAEQTEVKADPISVNVEVKNEPAEVNSSHQDTAAKTNKPLPTQPVSPLDIFSWARHLTIPPGCELPAGAEFTKTWKLKHFASGSEYDFEVVRLVHKSEGLLGDAVRANISFKREEVMDDAEVQVSIVGLRVPETPGEEVVEHWRFEDEKGRPYGQPLRLRFSVAGDRSGDSSLASSAVIMPSTHSESMYIASPSRSEFPPPLPAFAHLPAQAPRSPTFTATSEITAAEDDDLLSVHSSTSSFMDVEDVTTTSGSVQVDDELEREEFDFVDESEEDDEDTADEL